MIKRSMLLTLCLLLFTAVIYASPSKSGMIGPVLMMQIQDRVQLHEDNISFGMDSRFSVGPVPASVLVFFFQDYCEQEKAGIRINSYASIGAAFDAERFRVGAYAGPMFGYFFQSGKSQAFSTSLSMRITGDLMLKPMSLGVSYVMSGQTNLHELDADSLLSFFSYHTSRFTLSFLVPMR